MNARWLSDAPRGEPWEIEGKVAIVTGAGGGGTGRAIALRLARAGVAVVVNDIDAAGGAETVRRIDAEGGRSLFCRSDVTVEEDVAELVRSAEQTFGGVDILVNNAGGTPEPHFPGAPTEHWSGTLDLNLRGPMLLIEAVLPSMRARGGGAIVNISSVAGYGYAPHSSPEYAAAKAGLIRLTATLAPLGDEDNVRVNCIVPNWIGTEEVLDEIAAMTPEERADVPDVLTTPEEIAELVVELAENKTLAGRVVLWWTTEGPKLVPVDLAR
jgi:NAD(P)-dependent dehydrogenase (short-subunit alcohol dehydrogenase family)